MDFKDGVGLEMIYEISYANDFYSKALKLNAITAKYLGKADRVISYKPNDIDNDFFEKNKNILEAKRGNGYWLWKPYFISKTLNMINEGDYLYYCDAGSICIRKIKHLADFLEDEAGQDILCFNYPNYEYEYTKKEAFDLMGLNRTEIINSYQYSAVFIFIKNTERAREIINEWLLNCENPMILTEIEMCSEDEHYKGYIDHRYDQSVWSLVCKKNGLKPFRNPSTSKYDNEWYNKSTYPAINICIRGNNNNICQRLIKNVLRFAAVSLLKKNKKLYEKLKKYHHHKQVIKR